MVVEQTSKVPFSNNWNELRGLDLERLHAEGPLPDETILPPPHPKTPPKKTITKSFFSPSKGNRLGTPGRRGTWVFIIITKQQL